jgi:hypothetical protein
LRISIKLQPYMDSSKSQISIPKSPFKEKYQDIIKETIDELYANPRYWDFFQMFSEESVHDFIVEYATKKAWVLVNGDRMVTKGNNEDLIYHETAWNCLWEIQQLKLFRLQTAWRAGMTELQGIEVTRDFLCWEKNISCCPYIEPISMTELNHYMDYVRSDMFEMKNWLYDWQDYDIFKNKGNGHDLSPAWYRFNKGFSGMDHLELLPDIKGQEEKAYLEIWKRHYKKQLDPTDLPSGRTLPDLYMNYETLDFFIKTFESKRLIHCFEAVESKPEAIGKETELQDALRVLNRSTERIELPHANDWKESVIMGARNHRRKKILAHLPAVFENYLFRVSQGIGFEGQHDSIIYQEYLDNTLAYRETVREGRMLLASGKG